MFSGDGGSSEPVGVLQSILLGVVEGLTEFLPVSSTGHLIVFNAWLGRSDPAMEVAIQAGAIAAIAVLYWQRLWDAVRALRPGSGTGRTNLLALILVAAIPAAVVGLLLEDAISAHLFSTLTVAIALILGGVLLWWLERWQRAQALVAGRSGEVVETITLRQAFVIGLWQCLALVPGTSRSGATIAGGMLVGCSRTAAAEFSFLVGLPILFGASALKLVQDADRLTGPLLRDFAIASGASFVTALAVVVPFVAFLRRHTFVPFAVYRIGFGGLLLLLIALGRLPA
jgi:undecaprenyl-diphosphatase